jgi:hypothetical protein
MRRTLMCFSAFIVSFVFGLAGTYIWVLMTHTDHSQLKEIEEEIYKNDDPSIFICAVPRIVKCPDHNTQMDLVNVELINDNKYIKKYSCQQCKSIEENCIKERIESIWNRR